MEVLESLRDSTAVRKNKIRFYSIFHRYVLFILLLYIMVITMIYDNETWKIAVFDNEFTVSRIQLIYIYIVIFVITDIISFFNWKFYICKEGIYIRKIDLFVSWDEVIGISHVWINEYKYAGAGRNFFYNRKTLVIYREKYKPICIYNISLSALYIAKMYNRKIKVNTVSATLAAVFNIILNGAVIYQLWGNNFEYLKFSVFVLWILLYVIKVLVLPFTMAGYQNKIYGKYLSHNRSNKQYSSDVINI